MRRAHLITAWVACTVFGVLLLTLPDHGPRLFSLSAAHGPGAADAAGALLVIVGSALAWWWIWRDRRRLFSTPLWLRLAAPLGAGLGIGLIVASMLVGFPAWWAVGATVITAVQIGLFIVVSTAGMRRPTRIRVTGYVTRGEPDQLELLIFEYAAEAGSHLPGGGVEQSELLNDAVIRETYEETGVEGGLTVLSVVGVQQGRYDDTRRQYVNVYFHLRSNETRDDWEHIMIGDPGVWDTGAALRCRFLPLARATQQLRDRGHGQHAFVDLLKVSMSSRTP